VTCGRLRVHGSDCFAQSARNYRVRPVPHALPALIFVLALIAAFAAPALAQTPSPQDYSVITRVPREEADRWLKEQVSRSAGDFEHQRYHFVIGFSTGHYGSDPVHAIAMRRLAFSLLNNTLAPGDRVTPVAWEMSVWDRGRSIDLTTDPSSRAAFVDAVPYAPAEGSRGGHDTERALFEVLSGVSAEYARRTVVLLLTNTNQSQGPTGVRAELFGANNRRLAEAIQQRGYRPPVRHTFTAASRNRNLNIDVTALFPRRIAALDGTPTTSRYPTFPLETWQPPADRPESAQALPNPVQPATGPEPTAPAAPAAPVTAPAREEGGPPWPLIVIGGLVVLGILAWLLTRRKKPETAAKPEPAVKGRPIPGSIKATVGSAPNSKTVNLQQLTSASSWALVQDGDARPELVEDEEPQGTKLARLSFDERRRLTLEAEADVVFQSVTGIKPDAANPRRLVLGPGDHLVCRVAKSTAAGQPARLELMYQEKG
jgi:hypothetical protein